MKKLFILVALCFTLIGNTQTTYNWTALKNIPQDMRYGAGFAIGNYVYVGLGYSLSGDNKRFYRYDTLADTWQQLGNFPGVAIENTTSFAFNGKGYVLFGTDNNSMPTNQVWEFDPSNNSWSQKSPSSAPARYKAPVFVIGTTAYTGTGITLNGPATDFYAYDPFTDQWTTLASYPGNNKFSQGAMSLNGLGYLVAGDISVFNSYSNNMWQYDPSNDTWTQKASFPGSPRTRGVAMSLSDYGYFGFGYNNGTLYSDFYEYNPNTNAWSQANIAALPGPRYGAVVNSHEGSGYLATGVELQLSDPPYSLKFHKFKVNRPTLPNAIDKINVAALCNIKLDPVAKSFSTPCEGNYSEIAVYNLSGQMIYYNSDPNLTIHNLSNEPQGLYLVRAHLTNGNYAYQKIVLN